MTLPKVLGALCMLAGLAVAGMLGVANLALTWMRIPGGTGPVDWLDTRTMSSIVAALFLTLGLAMIGLGRALWTDGDQPAEPGVPALH